MADVQNIINLLLNGLALGCIYGLIALGFVLIYKATELVNFAQGDFVTVGAYIAFLLIGVVGLPYWFGLIAAIAVMFAFGFAMDVVIIRRLIGEPQFAVVMATIGIGYVLRFIIGATFGYDPLQFETPFTGSIALGGLHIDSAKAAALVGTVILCIILYLFFRRSRIGIAMQASSQNQLAAYYMGIPVQVIFSLIWGIGAAVALVAGMLLMPINSSIDPNMGLIGLKAFAGAVVGGFGSIPGALLGGIILGLVESFGGFFLPAGYAEMTVFGVVLAVMIIRPEGIFSQMGQKKV